LQILGDDGKVPRHVDRRSDINNVWTAYERTQRMMQQIA